MCKVQGARNYIIQKVRDQGLYENMQINPICFIIDTFQSVSFTLEPVSYSLMKIGLCLL